MKKFLPSITAALLAFILGFAVAWVIKPQEVQLVEVPVQQAVPATQPEAEPTPAPESDSTSAEDPSALEATATAPTQSFEVIRDGNTARDPLYNSEVILGNTYTSKYEVALYIYAFDELPSNYITKTKARNQGWVANKGNLWDVLPGMSIGGGGFDNIEGELPLPYDPDRSFKECDINFEGGYRGAERLVWSDDGYIFYTPDHYQSFELLYPHEGV